MVILAQHRCIIAKAVNSVGASGNGIEFVWNVLSRCVWFLSWCFYPFQHFQFSCVVPVLGGGSDLIGGKYSETIKQFTTALQ